MRALSSRPFCPCASRQVSLGDLSAAYRHTTGDSAVDESDPRPAWRQGPRGVRPRHRLVTDRARSPGPQDAPGAIRPGSRRCAQAEGPQAGGAPDPPGSCHRSGVCAAPSHPPPAPEGWARRAAVAGAVHAAECFGSQPGPTRGRGAPRPRHPEPRRERRGAGRAAGCAAPRGPRWWAAVR